MAKFIRYAVASVCFAASVGCLALWWHSDKLLQASYFGRGYDIGIATQSGFVSFAVYKVTPARQFPRWRTTAIYAWEHSWFADEIESQGSFGGDGKAIYFPLWYPALIFALAGVAALRFRCQFSIHSALIAMTVVAALLGMMAAL